MFNSMIGNFAQDTVRLCFVSNSVVKGVLLSYKFNG